jgi:hypothetical protein
MHTAVAVRSTAPNTTTDDLDRRLRDVEAVLDDVGFEAEARATSPGDRISDDLSYRGARSAIEMRGS